MANNEIIWHSDILNTNLTYHRVDLLRNNLPSECRHLSIHPHKSNNSNTIKISAPFKSRLDVFDEITIRHLVNRLNNTCGLNITINVDRYFTNILLNNFTEDDAEKAELILRINKEI